VRYVSAAAPIVTRMCWCRVCQYLAANGTVNVCFATEHFSVTGTIADYVSTADSGNIMHRRFCPTCGTQLFSATDARPHLVFVRAGTLDDPNLIEPAAVIWTASAPRWAHFDPGLARHDRQPPPPKPAP
jgi:hypothetical protein